MLDEYFRSIGGKPEFDGKNGAGTKKRKISQGPADASPASKGKGRKRGRTDDDTPKSTKKTWEPPKGSWENDVTNVDAVEEHPDPDTGEKQRFAYIMWNDGRKTYHPLSVINQKCPQKVCGFYCRKTGRNALIRSS